MKNKEKKVEKNTSIKAFRPKCFNTHDTRSTDASLQTLTLVDAELETSFAQIEFDKSEGLLSDTETVSQDTE